MDFTRIITKVQRLEYDKKLCSLTCLQIRVRLPEQREYEGRYYLYGAAR